MPPVGKPRLVNRGPAGLLSKKPANGVPVSPPEAVSEIKTQGINKIAKGLRDANLVVPIATLRFDPINARIHPERNIEALKSSLSLYGQVKPIVVRKETMIVVAGNGTMECAKLLGWTEIAASIVEMTEVEAAGYGLADNRTAELAKWDFEVVARLDKLLHAAGHASVGWSQDELEVLRLTDWTDVPAGEGSLAGIEEEVEEAMGDGELLAKLKATIEDPRHQVSSGEVYRVGAHYMVIACPLREITDWCSLIIEGMLFCPFPGPLIACTLAAEKGMLFMMQPDAYVAGHILDNYEAVHGEGSVTLVSPEQEGV